MNEVGLDPGIDHMSAMKIIDEAKSKGTKVEQRKSHEFYIYSCKLDSIFYFLVWWFAFS